MGFIRIEDKTKVPQNACRVAPTNGAIIVGHSETGHHHVLDAECAELYRLPDSILEALLVVEKPVALEHLREFDKHEPILFEPGVYRVKYLREYTPEGFRKVQD
jgi:hypothetical protein